MAGIPGIGDAVQLAQAGEAEIKGKMADIFGAIYAYKQMREAKKLSKGLVRPVYNPDENILYNQKLAQNRDQEGLPESSKTYYTNNIDRLTSSEINAVENTGEGGLNAISGVYDQSAQAFAKLLAMDAEAKQAKDTQLMGANVDVANENKLAFDYNKNIPYQQLYQHIAQLSNAAPVNLINSIRGSAAQDAASSATGQTQQIQDLVSFLKQGGNTSTTGTGGSGFSSGSNTTNSGSGNQDWMNQINQTGTDPF